MADRRLRRVLASGERAVPSSALGRTCSRYLRGLKNLLRAPDDTHRVLKRQVLFARRRHPSAQAVADTFKLSLHILDVDERAIRAPPFRGSENAGIADRFAAHQPFAATRTPELGKFQIRNVETELFPLGHEQRRDDAPIVRTEIMPVQKTDVMIYVCPRDILVHGASSLGGTGYHR